MREIFEKMFENVLNKEELAQKVDADFFMQELSRKLVEEYINEGTWKTKENSNMSYSNQGLNNHINSIINQNYWMSLYDKENPEIAKAFREGFIHLHNLQSVSSYCMGLDLEDLLKTGFGGVKGKVESKPPKHFQTALMQMVNAIFTVQGEQAGAIAYASFDTLLAPFIRYDNLTYEQVKQFMQEFIFNLNVSTRVGFQCLSDDTEILTENGWKSHVDVDVGTVIATYNMKNKNIEYLPAENMFKREYTGEMFSFFKGSNLISPKHRVATVINNEVTLKSIEDVITEGNDFKIPVISEGTFSDTYKQELIKISEIETINYSGIIWCPSTKNETIIARRNGVVFITGNCPFSNLTFDVQIPVTHKDRNVIIGGEEKSEPYADFQPEMDMINLAFCEIMGKGDAKGRPFSFPIPTINITNDINFETPVMKKILDVTGKYGLYYFANMKSSGMKPEDVRSMALLGNQELIFKNLDGRVSRNNIKHMVNQWISAEIKPNYKILMNGKFIKIIDMFEVPYKNYDKYVTLKLENGYSQNYSMQHKCPIVRDGEYKIIESQEVKSGDKFLLSIKGYNETKIGTYNLGKIVGYFLGDGWTCHEDNEVVFAINIHKEKIKNEIIDFFENFGCNVIAERQEDVSIYRIKVFGKQAVGLMREFVLGKNAKEKKFNTKIWNTSIEFRSGVIDGLYATDGHDARKILFHTTNKDIIDDIITLASSCGKILRYRKNDKNTRYFNKDKSDLETFTSYELKFYNVMETFNYNGEEYALVNIDTVTLKDSKTDVVYNFTVETDDHLFQLPNGIISEQCCRLRIDNTKIHEHMKKMNFNISDAIENQQEGEHVQVVRRGGLFNSNPLTGSIGVVTLNIPRMMYLANHQEHEFYKLLRKYMDIAKQSLEIKRKHLEKWVERGLYPYTKHALRNIHKISKQYWGNHFSTIGFIGMNEGLRNFGFEKGIASKEGIEMASEVMDYMLLVLDEYMKESDNLYNLEATPAEGASYSLAIKDKKQFPDIIADGNDDVYFYNSSVFPSLNTFDDMLPLMENQSELHSKFTGGIVYHWHMGECIHDSSSIGTFLNKIFTNYKFPYISITPVYSICPKCGFIEGEHFICPECERETEVYSRVVGYYRPVQNYNKGKQKEFEIRKKYLNSDWNTFIED